MERTIVGFCAKTEQFQECCMVRMETGTMRGYSLTALRRMSRNGTRWYRTFRRSSWDCPQCDAVAAVIHPVTEQVLPVHPYCVCGMYEIDLM